MLFDPWAFVLSTLFTINLDCITMFNFIRNSLVRTIGSSFFLLFLAQCLAFYQFYSNQFMAYNPCTSYLVIDFKSPYNKINKSENRSEVRTQSLTNTMYKISWTVCQKMLQVTKRDQEMRPSLAMRKIFGSFSVWSIFWRILIFGRLNIKLNPKSNKCAQKLICDCKP